MTGRIARWIGAITLALSAATALAQAPGAESAVIATDCSRACLIDHLRGYMAALGKRNPALLKLADDVRFSENEVVIPLGEGLWGTIDFVAASGLEVADAETGNAAWFGYVKEHGEPAILAVRIKVVDGRISEIQSIVHRKTGLPAPFGDVEKMVHDPAFNEVLPPAQRRSRERLIAVAQSYFNTVEVNDGMVFAPFDEDCGRLENGISTTSGGSGSGNAAAIAAGCEAQFKLGLYRINKRVRDRLYPLVDVERGIVVASGFFDHANSFDKYLLTNGREMNTALKWPNSIALLEAFRVRDGKIHRIEAVFTYVPYFKASPWAHPNAELAAASEAKGPACDRACLGDLADRYMVALVSKNSAALPWAETVGYSENGVPQMIGEGIWGTVTAFGKKPLVVADPSTGNIAWIGMIEEHGQPSYYAMRLKAVGRRIAEVETVIRRQQGKPPFGTPATFAPDPLFAERVPAAKRIGRERIAGLAEGWFNARADGDAQLARLAADFARRENGVPAAAGPLRGIDRVRDRRIEVIDEERGVAVAFGYRDVSARTLTDDTKYPRSYDFASVLKIDGDGIRRIEDIANETNYGMTSAWKE